MTDEIWYTGTIMEGMGMASGVRGCQEMGGTIRQQAQFFEKSGFSFDGLHFGTLNVDVSPCEYKVLKPAHKVENMKWHEDWPEETFSFFDCKIKYQDKIYKGYVYYPHPEFKSTTFFGHSMLEILSENIPDIAYNSTLEISVPSDQLEFSLIQESRVASNG